MVLFFEMEMGRRRRAIQAKTDHDNLSAALPLQNRHSELIPGAGAHRGKLEKTAHAQRQVLLGFFLKDSLTL